jgi:hypothetical protein
MFSVRKSRKTPKLSSKNISRMAAIYSAALAGRRSALVCSAPTNRSGKSLSSCCRPHGGDPKEPERIEFLCDGQQLVAFGIHPEIQQPYRWHGGEPGDIVRDDLPYIRQAVAQAFVEDLVAKIVLPHGYTRVQAVSAKRKRGDPTTFFQKVNTLALANLIKWVPTLFPRARQQKTGAWRVSSKDLGRDLEEDLSIHPDGIRDFGTEQTLTPLDLVRMRRSSNATLAALWLCEQIGVDPVELGYQGAGLADFRALMPMHRYIFRPTGELWPLASVDGHLGRGTALWLDRHAAVDQITWAPGEPELIKDRVLIDGGGLETQGRSVHNLFRPARVQPKPGDVTPWLEHVSRIYPDEADHIIRWLAHRVQRPEQKINHALVLGGKQGRRSVGALRAS